MKSILLVLVCGFGMSAVASANVVCESVKRSEGAQVIRGVKIKHDSVKFETTTWFGVDSAARDRAYRACEEVANATSCAEITPKVSDRYMDAGDPGFGPRMYIKNSSKAGVLSLQWAPADVMSHYPSDYSSLHGKYFAFYSGCEEARAELSHDVVQSYQREFLRIAQEKFLKENPSFENSIWIFAP